MRTVVGVVLAVSCVVGVSALTPATVQITDDGRSVEGTISPDGSKVAFVRFVKHYTADGKYYFSGRVCLWDGESTEVLAKLPGGKPTSEKEPDGGTAPSARACWTDSGRYILAGRRANRTLIRVADGARTRVGKHNDWFVMNAAWKLAKSDAGDINRIVHGKQPRRKWYWQGEQLESEDAPASVPRESEDWAYGDLRVSPTDARTALYVAEEKPWDGCCCMSALRNCHLGVADLPTGRLRRLTWGRNYRVERVNWSGDGEAIVYLRRSFYEPGVPVRWSDLYVVRPDGTGRRRLAREVAGYCWISPTRLVAEIGLERDRPTRQQLCIIDVRTGQVRWLTGGRYRHELADVRGDHYLVVEKPVGGNQCQGNLYLMHKPLG
ncbi:MAG: hypothetical protein PVH68_07050 [Armatimonadota bacterium]